MCVSVQHRSNVALYKIAQTLQLHYHRQANECVQYYEPCFAISILYIILSHIAGAAAFATVFCAIDSTAVTLSTEWPFTVSNAGMSIFSFISSC